jgi:hypothetical protein
MVRLFWVELLIPTESGLDLGSTVVPYLSMLSPSMLLPWFHVSVENRDLG